MTDQLLPCPFCGGEAKILEGAPGLYSADNTLYHAKCQSCGSCGASIYDHGRGGAIAAWNRRSVPEGWVLVPREPTPEMRAAALQDHLPKSPDDPPLYESVWRSMISAAPAAPTEASDE